MVGNKLEGIKAERSQRKRMIKTGRNDICPCGRGLKYKRCCLGKVTQQPAASAQKPPSVRNEIEKIQQDAIAGKATVREFGVFILFSTSAGDAWLLEISQSDALFVASAGEKVDFELEENPQTIEINWTHTFAIRNKQFVTKSYKEKIEEIHASYPSQAVSAAIKRITKKFPQELLDNVHLDEKKNSTL